MAKRTRPKNRRGVWLITGTLLVTAGIGGYFVYDTLKSKLNPVQCQATLANGEDVTLSTTSMDNAATIVAVSLGRSLPERAAIVAVATARQESKLNNVNYGDRDSLGLFQQRPSMGWGTAAQVTDPVYASGKFYSALVNVKDWQTLDIGVAAQKVQKSADPGGSSYTQWQGMATTLAAALEGDPSATLACHVDPSTAYTAETPGSDGLTPRAATLATQLQYGFKGIAPQYTHSSDGLSISLNLGGTSSELKRAFAQWAVARSSTLAVDKVQYLDQVWNRDSGTWQKTGGAPLTDQVTISVVKGG
jgi:hypothetical protein